MTARVLARALIGLIASLGLVVGSSGIPVTAAPAPRPVTAAPTTLVTGAAAGGLPSAVTLTERLLESAVVTLTNGKRLLSGCRPLRVNWRLRRAARRHSAQMAQFRRMSHDLPGEPWLGRRVTREGYRWQRVAENVAWGYGTAPRVVRAWWNSTTHRRNIKDCRLREIGVGVVISGGRVWWTQDFGRRR